MLNYTVQYINKTTLFKIPQVFLLHVPVKVCKKYHLGMVYSIRNRFKKLLVGQAWRLNFLQIGKYDPIKVISAILAP